MPCSDSIRDFADITRTQGSIVHVEKQRASSAANASLLCRRSVEPKMRFEAIDGIEIARVFRHLNSFNHSGPGGIVSWNVVQTLNFRDAMYYAVTGDPFDGKQAKQMGFVNFSHPKAKLREETVKLAKKLMEKSPAAMRYTKECIRAVRFMNEPQAADYLNAKSDALKYNDKENSRGEGMKQFLDDKTYRPGLGHFKRKKVAAK